MLYCAIGVRYPWRSRRLSARSLLIAAASSGLVAFGCGGGAAPPVRVPEAPREQAKCSIAASHSAPLVTEWPASEKARLESMTMQGGVVVSYSGCEMRILDGCSVGGTYAYQRTTLATDTIEIADQDELYAKLPLGAVSLEGELARSGRLAVHTTVVGLLRLKDGARVAEGGACSNATHVITGVAVGSFKLLSGGATSAGGGGSVAIVGGAKVNTSRSEQTMREAGDPSACTDATDEGAPANCRSPIQVFLTPVDRRPGPGQALAPARVAPENQRPTLDSVRINFAAYSPDDRWRLHDGNGALLCDLPCTRWIPKESSYYLELERPEGPKKVRLPTLDYSADREVDATVHPGRGSKALGIVATSVGGAMVFAGLVWMLSEGVIAEDPNLLASSIFTATGALVLTGGIVFTVYSRKDGALKFKVTPRPATVSRLPAFEPRFARELPSSF